MIEMSFLKKNKLLIAGIIIGAFGGFLYYHFKGCPNGTCAITSSPFNSSIYGAIMGGLLLGSFKKEDK
jgi:hypothetical protein